MVFGGWRGRWWWTGDTVVKGVFTTVSPDTVVNSKHSLYYSICDTVVKGVFTTVSVDSVWCWGVERALVVDRGSVY